MENNTGSIAFSDLSKLKEEVQNEKQYLVEIYRITFENFLINVFTAEQLKIRIQEAMKKEKNEVTFSFSNIKFPYSINTNTFSFQYLIKETFFYKWLMLMKIAVIKKEFKQYKKGINQIFEVPTKNELTIQEIKETVLDQSKRWNLILNELKAAGINSTVVIEDSSTIILKMSW
ncbi:MULTISPECIES: hypothetical protein [Bacillus]|nr:MULTISPECIES: hypothetical protein [Bacillus]AEA19746.1 hypothetical protein CT43_P72052 [Bacillus thuringiensis serovar chinensis CT-43]AFV22093.1 hypothetical protein BTB_78p00210 [Bacillus thuringiensis Bt407]AGG04555.1 hypothetical protein H175_68p31 [Bacillus thuringiensis serovar thuringiensis str. IS5056]ERH97390.1 hypothetical protein BTCBT_006487 [Bacillus thuringiensis T01-328]MCC3874903.1 hypothetical protein [Bacillus thuringiensis]